MAVDEMIRVIERELDESKTRIAELEEEIKDRAETEASLVEQAIKSHDRIAELEDLNEGIVGGRR